MKTLKILVFITSFSFILACSSNKYDNEALGTNSDSISATGLSGDSVKLIKTAGIDFKVKNVHESARKIARVVHSLNGIISDRDIVSQKNNSKRLKITDDTLMIVSSYITTADMLVKVPSAQLDTFVEQIYSTATFINHINIKIEDKSLDFLASRMKQQNREQVLEQSKTPAVAHKAEVEKTVKASAAHKNMAPVDVIEQKDLLVDQKITNRQIDADVRFSTVHLTFSENPLVFQEIVANNDLSVYRLPFWLSMRNAFSNGWEFFLSFIIGLTNLWMFIFVTVGIVYGFRYYKTWKAG